MTFQLCYNFISFLIVKIVIECPEETLIILENTLLKSQIYDKLVTV